MVTRVREEAQFIANERAGRSVRISAVAPTAGKSPVDAYRAGYALLSDIHDFALADEALSASGGYVLLDQKSGRITPTDVLDLACAVLADISSMKASLGLGPTDGNAPPEAGRTPSDVHALFEETRALLQEVN